MNTSSKKRFLSWVIAFLMVFTYVPATAYATDDVNVTADTEAAAVEVETESVEEQAVEADATEDVAKEDAAAETEDATVEVSEKVETYNSDAATEEMYDEVTVLGGDILISNSKGTGMEADGVVTILAEGAKTTTPTPNNIVVYNETDYAATLTFDYSATNYTAFSEGSAEGTFTKTLAAGEGASLSITGKEALSNNTATLTLSNFNLEPVQETSNVVFSYEESLGNITVAGQAVGSSDSEDVTYADGAELIATPNADARFLAWIDKDTNKILSDETTYTLKPIEDMSVEAVFVGENSKGYYMAGGKYLFADLSKAAAQAAKQTDKTVVLMNDATLTGTHTIPAGVTFLVPFDDANTVYTTAPEGDKGGHVTPKIYRTLKMAADANLTVNGVISLSAKHHAAVTGSNGGSPTGYVSFIEMEKGSTITINDGGALYAYGYITGEGNVNAKDGAIVYEYFQFEDWRGGTASLGVAYDEEKHGVFPISQYYVQNIEVPLKLEAGASEYVYTSVNIGGTTVIGADVEFMGSDKAMFNLENGHVIKSYDGTKDRLNIVAEGSMNLSPITVTMGSNSLNCSEYELPINSNITVKMNSGTATINQDLALLPGSEIIIEEGTTCVLNTGVGIYAYDADQWGNYCGAANQKVVPINYAPGKTYTRDEEDLADAKVQIDGYMDASAGYIYSTVTLDENGMVSNGGANIFSTGDGKIETKSGDQKNTYQFVQNGTEGAFNEIRVFPALLTNKDGSAVQTWDLESAGTYTYENGMWVCDHEGKTETEKTPASCEAEGVMTVTCCLDEDYHNYTYEAAIPATGHVETVKTNAAAATCTEDGNDAYWTCAECDKMFLDKDCTKETKEIPVIDALGHIEKEHDAKAATCTEIGWDAYVTCEREGCDYTTYKAIEALGHEEEHFEAVEKTCDKDGNAEYWYCDVCKVYFADAECKTKLDKKPVIAAGHEMEYFDEVPATCTEPGTASGGKCKVCGITTDAGVIEPLGHNTTYHEAVGVTCTEDGNIEHWKCSRCELTFADAEFKTTVEDPVIKAEGHKAKQHDAVEATCTTGGNDEYWTCETCGLIFADEACKEELEKVPAIDKLGHDLTKTDAKTATCKEDGNKEYWTCGRCEKMFEDEDCEVEFTEIPVIAKKEHTEVALKAVAPTCDAAGLTAGVKCSVCEEILVAQEEVPSYGGHKWDKGIVTQIPCMVKNPDTSAKYGVIYQSGTRYFACQNDGCKESKTEKVDWGTIKTYDEFVESLSILEDWAFDYAVKNNIEDPAALVIRYVRTGVDRYNSGSWEIMAGVDNSGFTDYVTERELELNDKATKDEDKVNVTGLKNVNNFDLPNGEYVDFGHMFGTMDISYTNKNSINHADVAGFFGDTTDLLSTADKFDVRGTVIEMTAELTDKYFLQDNMNWDDKFGLTDMLGDLDGYYLNRELLAKNYEKGMITDLIKGYFTEDLTEEFRAKYYLENRLQCGTSKAAVRNAVYMAYTGNSVISTLEGTREFKASGDVLDDMRKAACYTVADYICRLAGDYTADIDNPCFTVQSEQFATLAPGITQEIKTATMPAVNENGEPVQYNMKYYIATADITRDDVHVYANYPDRPIKKDENGEYIWSRMRVLDQANKAQETYGNPESELYIPNFNVIASTNADGYEMTGNDKENRGEPGGLLIMDGEEIAPITSNGFFGITKEGKAVIGTTAEYNNIYKDQIAEAVGGFGSMLVKDGKIATSDGGGLASRTAVGITASGKVVMMVLDGRQQLSVGGDMLDLAHIMLEAGCVEAINLDGGGSTTYVAKQPGDDQLSLMNNPSDGYQRSVASSLMVVSTAKSSTVFDHAELKAPTNYMTVGSEMQITASGVTSTGNAVDVPENVTWAVSNDKVAKIDADGKLTALRTGTVDVNLMHDGISVGQKRITVVIPDTVTFTKGTVDVVYESKVTLPIKAYYEGKAVTVNANDFDFAISNETAGKMDGLSFAAGTADSGIKKIEVTAKIKGFDNEGAKITIRLYNQGEGTFDFDKKTGGDRQFAWQRTVTNSQTADNSTYYAIDTNKDMETTYTFAIDMEEIPIPPVLEELTDMLPGNDVEGACAWTYLCNLAQRISDITEVTATVKIDDHYKLVDINKIDVKNEYFKFPSDGTGVTYDEENNTLTLKLNWVRQYSPIDLETADPLCMVTGIRLVPKDDADWGDDKTVNIITKGDVSYNVYMRASSLYTFCNDKSNQEKYGLKPFSRTYIDKDGVEQTEAGGGFGSTYKTFTDSYTLVNAVKNGWLVEDGGWTYYKDGERLTGINEITERVDGVLTPLYYDFGETGVISEQTPYTGMIREFDATGTSYRYAVKGVLKGGWVEIDGVDHYFDPATKKALPAGEHAITVTARTQSSALGDQAETITETVTYQLDETGKVMNGGTWFVNDEGKTYFYYGSGFLCRQWGKKDGHDVYFAMKGHLLKGIVRIREDSERPGMYYMFDDETGYFIKKCEGFVEYKGYTYYYAPEEDRMNGLYPEDSQEMNEEADTLIYGRVKGFQQIDGKYYMFTRTYGAQLYGKRTVEHGIEGACTTLNFDKSKGGYAVDKNGNPRTDLSHVIVTDPAVPATCTTTGLTEGSHCEECGVVVVAQKKIPVDEHSYGAKQYKTPTAKANGGYYQQCKECKQIKWTSPQTYAQYVKANVPKTTVKATATGSRKTETVTVKWTTSTNTATYYKVYRATKKSGSYKYIGTSKTKSYVDKKAKVGKTYYYKVIGYAAVGKTTYKTKTSNIDSAKIAKTTAKYVKATRMSATTTYGPRSIIIKWTSPRIKADGYEVWRSTSKNGKYTKIGTRKASSMQYTDKKVKVGKRYYYKVRAYKKINGKKVYTKYSYKGWRYALNTANGKIAKAIDGANAITAKSAVKTSSGIKVTWTKKSSVKCNKYEVYRATSKNGTYKKIGYTSKSYYTDKSKLTKGKRYYYKVKGYRYFGKACPKTAYSNAVSAVK